MPPRWDAISGGSSDMLMADEAWARRVGAQGSRVVRGLCVTFALNLLLACSDDASTGSGANGAGGTGGASSSGTGAAGGELGPEDFLQPSQYDCSATEPNPEPPSRP